jgi:hypothetical protein
MTWGSYTLPGPDPDSGGIQIEHQALGSARRMRDGTLRAQITAHKDKIIVRWHGGFTAAERAALRTAWEALRDTAASLTLPDGTSYTSVTVATNSLSESLFFALGETPLQDSASLTFEEV